MNEPLVTVCIPNYNNEKFISDAITSILNQTYKHIRILVIDNASTDNSVDLINRFKLEQEQEINLIVNSENIGMVNNFNKCLRYCTGDYVLFLSSDDMLTETFIERCIEIFKRHDVGMVGTNFDIISSNGNIKKNEPFYKESCIIKGVEQAKVFLMGNCFAPSQVLIKKEYIDEINGFDIKYNQTFDWSAWFKICLHHDLGYINESLSLYRIHDNNATSKKIKDLSIIFELHSLRLDFVEQIKENNYLRDFKEECLKKTGRNALKYCIEMIELEEYNIAKQYLKISSVFDTSIIKENTFKILETSLYSGIDNPLKLYTLLQKNITDSYINAKPYDLPPDSIILR